MKTVKVVAAVIKEVNDNGEPIIFATQRGYGEFKDGWEFPGGKIEAGETPQEALKREIMEELDTKVKIGNLIDTIEYDYPNFHLLMDCFWCEIVSGELKLKEHENAKWLTKEHLDDVEWLPADVIFMLIGYCIDVFTEKYGPGRLPSMRSIEKEAYSWANKEIITIEQADEYIRNAAEKRSRAGELKTSMGLGSRVLTPTERKYMTSWFDMGFDNEAILIAYDRTVTNTGALKWGYMNKIMLSWHDKGIHSSATAALRQAQSRRKISIAATFRAMSSSVCAQYTKRLKTVKQWHWTEKFWRAPESR